MEFKFELIDWININNLNWDYLSLNPNAIDLLEKNQEDFTKILKSGLYGQIMSYKDKNNSKLTNDEIEYLLVLKVTNTLKK